MSFTATFAGAFLGVIMATAIIAAAPAISSAFQNWAASQPPPPPMCHTISMVGRDNVTYEFPVCNGATVP